MRLIDADALLSAYDKTHEGPPGKARELIEEAPTVNGWISVKDRLPELKRQEEPDLDGTMMEYYVSEEVIVLTPDGVDIGALEDDGDGIFWGVCGCEVEVSHWMPIPQQPQEE